MPSRSRQKVRPQRRSPAVPNPSGERLQKVLAAAGVGSRRECEELIVEGRVEIDRRVVRELGTRVDPQQQEIRVDGVALTAKKRLYYLVNKPEGVVCTNRDPSGRPRVIDLIETDQRLFPVGRLDMSTEGLILVTNDGEMANRLAHPRYGVPKTYVARVVGEPSRDMLEKLKTGVHLAEGVARVAEVKVRRRVRQGAELEIVLEEGKNREVRRLLAAVGHKVQRLRRIAIGPLRLGELPPGAYRRLMPEEIRQLERFLTRGLKVKKRRPRRERPSGGQQATETRAAGASRPQASRGAAEKRLASGSRKEGTVLGYQDHRPREEGVGGRPDARQRRRKGKRRP